MNIQGCKTMQRSRKLSEGPNSDYVFLFLPVDEGREDHNITISMSSLAVSEMPFQAGHYRSTSEMPLKWRFTDGREMAQH